MSFSTSLSVLLLFIPYAEMSNIRKKIFFQKFFEQEQEKLLFLSLHFHFRVSGEVILILR